MKKKILIGLGVAAVLGLGYYFLVYKKKDAHAAKNPADKKAPADTTKAAGKKSGADGEESEAAGGTLPVKQTGATSRAAVGANPKNSKPPKGCHWAITDDGHWQLQCSGPRSGSI